MSILIRAALLGGLAYVVSRAVRSTQDSNYLSQSGTRRLSQSDDDSETWPAVDRSSTSNM